MVCHPLLKQLALRVGSYIFFNTCYCLDRVIFIFKVISIRKDLDFYLMNDLSKTHKTLNLQKP